MIRLAIAAALCWTLSALAQQAPLDAGSQLRDAEKKPPALPRKPPPSLEFEQPARPAIAPVPGAGFTLRNVRFSGNSVFSSNTLERVVYDYLGRQVGLAELEEAAARVTRYYRDKGYLVTRAYLPQQDIRDGVVEIAVLEGRLGQVILKNESRVRDGVILDYFEPLVGEAISENRLERKLLLVSELPGISPPVAALRPGERVGESAMWLDLARTDATSASFELDNYGSYFSGEWRLSAALELASPTGYGDRLSARLTHGTPGLDLVQLGYLLPLGSDGLRIGLAYSSLAYELGKGFAALEAHGRAESAAATLSYPFVRQRAFSVSGLAGYTHRTFEDRIDAAGTQTDKKTDVGTLGLGGDWRDALGGGGVNVWTLVVAGGQLDIETPVALAVDEATLGTHGGFQKLNWSLMRGQRLSERWSALLSFSGQMASDNLDSSEKFTLGGPYGVRAFPLGEGSGDQGILASAELRFDVTPAVLQAIAFVDAGRVRVNHDPPPGSGDNKRELSALGVGLNWTPHRRVTARAIAAWGNEDSTSAPDRRPRAWLQAAYRL